LPPDATHLVISAGGNDALLNVGILDAPARSAADTLAQLADLADLFEADYAAMLSRVRDRALPFLICTIYNGNFEDRTMQRLAATALAVFNDVILRQAIELRIPVIDLRAVCCAPEDYANPIEPSAAGGEKIAAAIARVVEQHNFDSRATIIYDR
jgi:lysophospholipase L1-like esterase